MTMSRQFVFGHCLLSPLSAGQEREEKIFFRRNTEIMCQLLNKKAKNNIYPRDKAIRSTDDCWPIRSVSSNDVIRIPYAQFGRINNKNGKRKRPHTTSPMLRPKAAAQQGSKYLQDLFNPLSRKSSGSWKSDENDCYGLDNIILHNGNLPITIFGGIKRNAGVNSDKRLGCLGKPTHPERGYGDECRELYDNNDDDDDDEYDDDADISYLGSRASSPQYAKLIASHRHPPSVHCDTLGPGACKYCARRLSESSTTPVILPNTGVISSSSTTFRVPSLKTHKVTWLPNMAPSQSVIAPPPLRDAIIMPEPYTPLSVFLRARRNKRDNHEKLHHHNKSDSNDNTPKNPHDNRTKYDAKTLSNNKSANVDKAHLKDDTETVNDAEEGDDKNIDLVDELEQDVGFDGLRVRVTFKNKNQSFLTE